MILIDATPLVALCDPRDELHARALKDLDRIARRPLLLAAPVLTEACFLLPHGVQRARLERLLAELRVRPVEVDEEKLWSLVFAWLAKYAEHEPDWADGYLVALSSLESGSRIWTYDEEFSTLWRRLDGTRVPLFAARPK